MVDFGIAKALEDTQLVDQQGERRGPTLGCGWAPRPDAEEKGAKVTKKAILEVPNVRAFERCLESRVGRCEPMIETKGYEQCITERSPHVGDS